MKRGRPLGSKNKPKPSTETISYCLSVIDDPLYRRNLLKRARSGRLRPAMECMLWYYAKGKPPDTLNLNDDTAKQELAKLSDRELLVRHDSVAKMLRRNLRRMK